MEFVVLNKDDIVIMKETEHNKEELFNYAIETVYNFLDTLNKDAMDKDEYYDFVCNNILISRAIEEVEYEDIDVLINVFSENFNEHELKIFRSN